MKNHIKIALLALFLYCNLLTFSQTLTPAFSVKIAFEDKAKHKDTITIGYDPLANADGIDTLFGEQNTWGVPWDSLFETRVLGPFNYYNLGKVAIAKQTNDSLYCYATPSGNSIFSVANFGVHFRCKSENFPVKITWDYTQFSGTSCHNWSAIVYNCATSEPSLFPVHRMSLPFGVFNLQTPYYYSQIAGENGYVITTPSNVLIPGGGLTTDTVYMFMISLSSKPDLFNSTWIVTIQDQTISQLNSKVYPNPAQNEVNVTLPEPAWCYITDMSGKTVQNTYLQTGTSTIDVSVLPKGLYLMRLQSKNQRYSVHKLMVE
jgi:hypothetical protein